MDNVEEEADDIYNGILGEIGLEYQMQDPVSLNSRIMLFQTRIKGAVAKKQQEEVKSDAADDLEARLAALKM